MKQDEGVKDPPKVCPNCGTKRIGIQEGVVYFTCGTTITKGLTNLKCQHG